MAFSTIVEGPALTQSGGGVIANYLLPMCARCPYGHRPDSARGRGSSQWHSYLCMCAKCPYYSKVH